MGCASSCSPLSAHLQISPPNSVFSRFQILVSLFGFLVWSLWKVETMAQSDSDGPKRVVFSSGSWTVDITDTPPFESEDPFTTCVRVRCWGNSGTSQPMAGESFPGRFDATSRSPTSSWSDFDSSCRIFHCNHHHIGDQEGGHQRQARALVSANHMIFQMAEELTSQTQHHLKLFQPVNAETMSKPARSESHDLDWNDWNDWKDGDWQETTHLSGPVMDLGPEVLDPAWTASSFLGPDLGHPAGFQESRATVTEPDKQHHKSGVTQLLLGGLGDSECQAAQTQAAQAARAGGANVNADAHHILEATKAQILSHSSDITDMPSSSSRAWTAISIATAIIWNFTDASSWRFEASLKMEME